MSVNLNNQENYLLSNELVININKMFKYIVESEGVEDSNVNLKFISSDEMKTLNNFHRGIHKDTNVLSFENQDLSRTHTNNIGDIAISYPYVENEAYDLKKDIDDHILHMFTHGMLHILGFDHENDKEADNMELKEIEFLSKFNIINPYTL